MPTVEELVALAKRSYRAGRVEEARSLMRDALQRDSRNEEAWFWLSGMMATLEEQRLCLRNVLALNPAHERARQGLESVEQKLAATASRAASVPRGERAPLRDPDAPVTSVEWKRDDAPAVYGSGKQVTLPTGKDYDAWVNDLYLTTDASLSPVAPFVDDEPGPFGDTASMVDTAPFVDPASLDRLAGTPTDPGDLPGARPDLAGPVQRPTARPQRTLRHEFSFEDEDEDLPASAESSAVLEVPVPPVPPPVPERSVRAELTPSAPEAYFAYIPPEITAARARSRPSWGLLLAIVLLILANAAAIVALVSAL